ncbi:MAG: hypothetical protein COA44_01150 [Arcobacter sp.]|nr:MAG: hypothetical protein COA44_01150 [Arcobacter sp.]
MRYLLILSFLSLLVYAQDGSSSYEKINIESKKVNALIQTDIASHKAYEIINNYLDLASSTIANCSISDDTQAYRIMRELKADMKRVSPLREKFRVQTFNELKEEAMVQAKKEVQCTNVYNNTYIRRPLRDEVQTLPIKQ